jgi:uncharacterized protein YkwD
VVTNLQTHVSKTTWANGKGTTIADLNAHSSSAPNRCPNGTSLFVMSGRIIGGSGAALRTLSPGMTVRAHLCVSERLPATIEAGSAYKFGTAATPRVATTTTTTTTRPATTTTRPATTTTRPATTTTRPPTTTTTTPAPGGTNVPPAITLPAGLADCPQSPRATMIALVNTDRHGTGNLPALAENANLDWAARDHSIVMATNSVMSHNGWDTEIQASNYVVGSPGWTGQNIAWMTGGYAPATIESSFFNEVPPDDGHRLNILSANYHNIGIGCIVNQATGAYWWTQDFGS